MSKNNSKDTIPSNFLKGVYSGNNAKTDYINPINHPYLPLIELTHKSLNPFLIDNVRIFAKDLRIPPLFQVKSGAAFEMNRASMRLGKTKKFEATSFNAGMAITLFSKGDTTIYVPPDTPVEKIMLLQLAGAQVIIAQNGILLAHEQGKLKGNLNLNQYNNPSNPDFFYRFIGPQLYEQTKNNLTVFCTGLGTTGTMLGIGKYLKEQNPNILTIGTIVKKGDCIPGVRTLERLKEVSHNWKSVVDVTEYADSYHSYLKSLELIRHAAILAGPSTGFGLQGLLQKLQTAKKSGHLNKLRNSHGQVVAVFTIADSPHIYSKEYFKILGDSYFLPVIKK